MLRILNNDVIINGSGIFVTAESSAPFEDFNISACDQILLFTDERDLFISVEYAASGDVFIYGYTNTHVYPYVFIAKNKERIKEDILDVVKEFI